MLADADVSFVALFLPDADDLFRRVLKTTAWEDRVIRMYGKDIPLPRRTAWYGDAGSEYVYSGIKNEPRPWTEAISDIRARVEEHCGVPFNSVLLNRYRTGKDSVAWHADDEPELGDVIASVSLGGTRTFQFKHKHNPEMRASVALSHGSLLVMRGDTQKNWLHQIPKTTKPVAERINLTFRQVRSR